MNHQANKLLIQQLWQALDSGTTAQASATAADVMRTDVCWHGYEPVGQLQGVDEFITQFWQPFKHAFADLRRETFIFLAGQSNGRIDGDMSKDGKDWVTGTGVLHATFANDYLGIRATGQPVAIRWGEFCRIESGKVAELFFLIDMIDLLEQAGIAVLPPARGIAGLYPPPALADGFLSEAVDDTISSVSLTHIRRFLFEGLNAYDENALESMGMADFFHPQIKWYGPGGIGACLSLRSFEDDHQRPWLHAYPDRSVQNLDALIAEANYSAACGWAGVKATHTGPYLNCAATGKPIEFNGLDWWKRDSDRYIENWVFVDMIHLFGQFGVDLLSPESQHAFEPLGL